MGGVYFGCAVGDGEADVCVAAVVRAADESMQSRFQIARVEA